MLHAGPSTAGVLHRTGFPLLARCGSLWAARGGRRHWENVKRPTRQGTRRALTQETVVPALVTVAGAVHFV